MGREKNEEPLWFTRVKRIVLVTVPCIAAIYYLHRMGAITAVERAVLGPSSEEQVQHRDVWDRGMQDLDEAIKRRNPSILAGSFCGEGRKTAEQIVREGNKRRVRVSEVQHPPDLPWSPQIVSHEVWDYEGVETPYTIKGWLGTCDCSRAPEGIPEPSCIVKFHPSEVGPLY